LIKHLVKIFPQELNKNSQIPTALLVTFTYALSYVCIIFLPLYLKYSIGYTIAQSGIFLAFFGVGYVGGSFLGGRLCDRYSSYKIALTSAVSYCVITFSLYFIGHPHWLVAVLLVLLGFAVSVFSPAARIYLMNLTPASDRNVINSVRYSVFNIGCAISCGLGGVLAGIGYHNIFLLAAISSMATVIILFFFCDMVGEGSRKIL